MNISLSKLSIGYSNHGKDIVIQNEIEGEIRSGEFICLLGPNGSGKTTLLRTLSGLLPAVGGEIRIDSKPFSSMSSIEISRMIAIVLTERPSSSSMTSSQLIGLGRSPYTGFWGRLDKRDHQIIMSAMTLTDTTHLENRLVDTLSDGECQRVMIARALAQETSAIFLDEPTAFLDFPGKVSTMLLLKDLAHNENKAIMFSTHDVNLAISLADKLWLVDKKHGITMGTVRDLSDNGAFARYFNGDGVRYDYEKMEFIINNKNVW